MVSDKRKILALSMGVSILVSVGTIYLYDAYYRFFLATEDRLPEKTVKV